IYRKKPKFKDLDSRLRGNDGLEITRNKKKNRNRTSRIPACAGMTGFQVTVFDFLFCGNNGILDDVHLSRKLKTLRRHSRESGNPEFQCRKNLSEMDGI
ncbi:TPA: hypothetical protein ACJCRF_001998, partial [Neisseria meningitidis]